MLKSIINHYPFISDLLRNMPENVLRECSVCKIDRLSILLDQSLPVNNVYLICSGRLIVECIRENGLIYDFEEIGENQFVGELEAISGEVCSLYTVKAVEDCIAVRIPREYFLKWLDSDLSISTQMLKSTTKKWMNMAYIVSTFKYYDSRYKISVFIINNALQDDNNRTEYRIKETRQSIADRVGLNVRTVNRAICSLQKAGYIEIVKGKICITENKYARLLDATKNIKAQKLSINDSTRVT